MPSHTYSPFPEGIPNPANGFYARTTRSKDKDEDDDERQGVKNFGGKQAKPFGKKDDDKRDAGDDIAAGDAAGGDIGAEPAVGGEGEWA